MSGCNEDMARQLHADEGRLELLEKPFTPSALLEAANHMSSSSTDA